MCTRSCRTFLWGGKGTPRYEEGGRCFCVCEDDSWSDLNLLGRASCVPDMAHTIYGWAGLVLGVAALCHAVYHLHRQLRFNAQQLAPWTTCAEQCRRSLHIVSVIVAVLSLFYFALILGDYIRWSVHMLVIAQFPVNISCSFYATRMWIYAIDPRLMHRSQEVLAISARMEKSNGRRVAWWALWTPPSVAFILDFAGLTHYTMKAIAMGIVFQAVVIGVAFLVGGRSLLNAINESLRQCQQRRRDTAEALSLPTALTAATTSTATIAITAAPGLTAAAAWTGAAGKVEDKNDQARGLAPGGSDQTLLAAKKKVKRMMIFALQTVVMVMSMLLVAVFTDYGVEMPLPIFIVPITYVPLIWDIVNVQLHAGRSKIPSRPPRRLRPSVVNRGYRRSLTRRASSVYLAFHGNQQVVPTDQPAPEN